MEEEKDKIKNRQNKLKSLLGDLQSGNEKRILKALSSLKAHGDETVIMPLIDLWNKGVNKKVEQKIITFLGDIRTSSSVEYIMDAVLDDTYSTIRQPLLTVIWSSKVDYSNYLVELVALAIQNNFMITLECLTIIENLEGPFEEHHILDAEIIIREYADEHKKNVGQEDQKKLALIQEISQIIISPEMD